LFLGFKTLFLVGVDETKVVVLKLGESELSRYHFDFVVLLNPPNEGLDFLLFFFDFVVPKYVEIFKAIIHIVDFIFNIKLLLSIVFDLVFCFIGVLGCFHYFEVLSGPVEEGIVLENLLEVFGTSLLGIFLSQVVQDEFLRINNVITNLIWDLCVHFQLERWYILIEVDVDVFIVSTSVLSE